MTRKSKSHIFYVLSLLILTSSIASAETLINEEVNVPALAYMSYYLEFDSNQVTIDLSIDTFLSDISVYIMDNYNYNQWKNGYTCQVYFQRHELVDGDYTIELGPAGVYYLVLDNTDSFFSSSVDVKVSIPSPISEIVIIAVVLGVIILIVFGVLWMRRNQNKQYVPPPVVKTPYSTLIVNQPVQNAVKYCRDCGSRLDADSTFCTNCGTEQ